MRVVIAGGHGKIGLRLARRLAAAGDEPVGLIRSADQAADVREAGAEPVVLDLERADVDQVTEALAGAEVVVFAAGAGPGSGAARKDTVDRGAAVLLAEAAERVVGRRYIQISSMGVDDPPPPGADEVFAAYLRAKKAAEDDLRARPSLDWTILRPGRLTDEPGTGQVRLGESVEYGQVSREDVAAVIVPMMWEIATFGRTLELTSGNTPVEEAVRRV